MIKKILWIVGLLVGGLSVFGVAHATSIFQTFQGGTGTSTPSGILYGDNGATTHLNTAVIGSGLSFSGGTLSASGSGTVTNVATTYPLSGGPITTTGTLSLLWGTTTPWATGQSVFVNANGNISSVATSTQAYSPAFSTTGTQGADVGGTSGTRSSNTQPSIIITGTTTATGFSPIQGTTTITLQNLWFAETLVGAICNTDIGTMNVQFGSLTSSTTLINASTTRNQILYASNNSFSGGQSLNIEVGTPASGVTKLTCTPKLSI